MAYYCTKYPRVAFVVASDDLEYCRATLPPLNNVYYSNGSRDEDLATLASCNSSIITVGTFGFWCGYLSGGEVLYPNLTYKGFYEIGADYFRLAKLEFFTPISDENESNEPNLNKGDKIARERTRNINSLDHDNLDTILNKCG